MFDIDWNQVGDYLLHLLIAYALALPCAWDREKNTRIAGIRTYPLVAIGACAFLLVGRDSLPDLGESSRLMQGLIGGLGFLGGGAILKNKDGVVGMATAACIWNTGALGMAVAYQRYEIAIVLSALSFITLRVGSSLKDSPDEVPVADDHDDPK